MGWDGVRMGMYAARLNGWGLGVDRDLGVDGKGKASKVRGGEMEVVIQQCGERKGRG